VHLVWQTRVRLVLVWSLGQSPSSRVKTRVDVAAARVVEVAPRVIDGSAFVSGEMGGLRAPVSVDLRSVLILYECRLRRRRP